MSGMGNTEGWNAPSRVIEAESTQMLRTLAFEAYHNDNDWQSIALFQKLIDREARDGNVAQESYDRFWLGTALHNGGRLMEALAAMAPALDRSSFSEDRETQSRILSRYILVAVDLPLPLAQIEQAMNQVERVLESWGWLDLDSRIPLARSRLASLRGHTDEALRWARIAMARYPRDPAAYADHTYQAMLLKACWAADRLDLLRDHVATWRGHLHEHYQSSRLMVANLTRAASALGEGDRARALVLAAQASEGAWSIQDFRYHTLGLSECARLMIALDRPQAARRHLARLMALRHAESGNDRFAFRMLLGDYHLAEAKRLLAGPSLDRQAAAKRLAAAAGSYRQARKVAEIIDARLDSGACRDQADRQLGEVAHWDGQGADTS